jgi:hypothetical protein
MVEQTFHRLRNISKGFIIFLVVLIGIKTFSIIQDPKYFKKYLFYRVREHR